jgi:hypothetical protein
MMTVYCLTLNGGFDYGLSDPSNRLVVDVGRIAGSHP